MYNIIKECVLPVDVINYLWKQAISVREDSKGEKKTLYQIQFFNNRGHLFLFKNTIHYLPFLQFLKPRHCHQGHMTATAVTSGEQWEFS